MHLRQDSRSRTADWSCLGDLVERGIDFLAGPRQLELMAQAGTDPHGLQLPVPRFAKHDRGRLGAVKFFEIGELPL